MSAIEVICPQCGKELRLRDRSLLGRVGRCPKCAHRFVLELAPDEVQLELAETVAQPAPATHGAVVGRAAQWVPDQPVAPVSAASPAPLPAVGEAPAVVGVQVDAAAERRSKFRRRRRSPGALLGLGLFCAALAGGGYYVFMLGTAPVPQPRPPAPAAPAASVVDTVGPAASPTHGKPIELKYIPSGARIIVNLHPAALWTAGKLGEGEFLACLGPFGKWLGSAIQAVCEEEPAKIEEALICLILGERGAPPQVAAVVHLKEEAKRSDLLAKFGGERKDDLQRPYYLRGDRAYLLQDTQTYAICPAELAAEMVEAAEFANPTDTGIEELLPHTDRDRLFTLVFVPQDIRLHAETLTPAAGRKVVQGVVDWLAHDDEVETVAWSFHLGESFFTQVLLRNSRITKASKLRHALETQVAETPQRLLDLIRRMNPQELGPRRVIGRVPAMSKAVALTTQATVGDHFVSLAAELPERAGPNLALGTLLAFDEATRTNFNAQPGPASPGTKPSPSGEPPALLVDRLKTKIDVDFRREPLFSAFDYVANEAKFQVFVDGDALKLAGYTKNMPQTFMKEQTPATDIIQQILTPYDQMCVIVDEQKKLLTVTTKKWCEDHGVKPYTFGK